MPEHRRLPRGAAAVVLLLAAACGRGTDPGAGEGSPPLDGAPEAVAPEAAPAIPPFADGVPSDAGGDTATAAGTASAATPDGAPAPPPDRPPPATPVTETEVREYRLSMERIRQLARAGEELAEAQARIPTLRDSMAVGEPGPNAILERLQAVAPAREAVARAGLTPREYTLATGALIQAAMAAEIRARGVSLPTPVNEENVRLYTENREEIGRMMARVVGRAPVAP